MFCRQVPHEHGRISCEKAIHNFCRFATPRVKPVRNADAAAPLSVEMHAMHRLWNLREVDTFFFVEG